MLWGPALAAVAAMLVYAARNEAWSDYANEALPAFTALGRGDLHTFLTASPAYGSSLVLRAPFAALAAWLGGGELAVFRAGALPCLLALAALAVHLARRAQSDGARPRAVALTLLVAAASPLAWQAITYGHPEDILAAAAAVSAVLAARAERPLLAGLALGVAIASKEWAVLAALPALMAAPRGRFKLLAVAALVAGGLELPMLVIAPAETLTRQRAVAGTGTLLHPSCVWWPFAQPPLPDPRYVLGAYRAPAWISNVAHPLILLTGLAIPLAWAARRRDRATPDILLVLAAVLLARCALDPWNNVYYELPVPLALLAWEVSTRRQLPAIALAVTAGSLLSQSVLYHLDANLAFATWLAWALPLAVWLARALFAAPRPRTAPLPAH